MAFSSSKVEAPQITGSLFGTASWAVSASWAPSNGVSQGVAYQTAQSGTLFDVTLSKPGLPPAQTRSLGGDLQPGDMNVLLQNNFGSESIHLVYKLATTQSIAPEMGGTGQPKSKFNGRQWVQIVTSDFPSIQTFLSAATSSVEGATQGSQYHSGSATTGSIYYATNLQKYRVYKGLGNGGWQDLVQTGSSVAAFPYTGSARILGTLNVNDGGGQTVIANGAGAVGSGNYVLSGGGFASGYSNTSLGQAAHAEGSSTNAGGFGSHAEGTGTAAEGSYSHAEGESTTATGLGAHAEGGNTKAVGRDSHAEGGNSWAIGLYSHAEGELTTAVSQGSHAAGYGTIASGSNQFVVGIYNDNTVTQSNAFMVGNGTFSNVRSNVIEAFGSTVNVRARMSVTGSLMVQSGSGITGSGEVVSNAGDTFTSTAKVTKMVTCTAAEYAAIATKDPNTFYIVI
jgi:hypothetical protein